MMTIIDIDNHFNAIVVSSVDEKKQDDDQQHNSHDFVAFSSVSRKGMRIGKLDNSWLNLFSDIILHQLLIFHLLTRTIGVIQVRNTTTPLQFCDLLSKKCSELLIPHVVFLAQGCQALPDALTLIFAAETGFLTVHEADGCDDECPDIPSRGPSLLMVVREARADGHVYLETSRWCVEVQLGCFEWIIFMKFQQPMIVSSLVRWMKTVQAEVELQVAYPSHEGVLQWIPLEFCRFLLQTQECKFLSHCYFIIKGSSTYSKWRKRGRQVIQKSPFSGLHFQQLAGGLGDISGTVRRGYLVYFFTGESAAHMRLRKRGLIEAASALAVGPIVYIELHGLIDQFLLDFTIHDGQFLLQVFLQILHLKHQTMIITFLLEPCNLP